MAEDYGPGHNSAGLNRNQTDALKRSVKRILKLYDERDAITSEINDAVAALGLEGYNKKAVRKIISEHRQREKNPEKFEEDENDADLYRVALGFV